MPMNEIPLFEDPDFQSFKIKYLKSLFLNASSSQLKGIKRPNYLAKKECPENIHKTCPDAKLIAVLRNPVDRALSAYYHSILYGFAPAIHHESGLGKIINGEWNTQYKRTHEIIEFGFYYKQLRRFLDFFPEDHIKILLQEDVIKNKRESLKDIFAFLNIDPDFVPYKNINKRPQAVIYSIPRLKLLGLKNKCIFKYNKDRTRLTVKKNLPFKDRAYCKVIDSIDRYIYQKISDSRKAEYSTELKHQIYDIYKEDIEALERLINRDLSAWKIINDD